MTTNLKSMLINIYELYGNYKSKPTIDTEKLKRNISI